MFSKTGFLLLILFQCFLFGGSNYYQGKFDSTKKQYLGAVVSGNKDKEIKYLKDLINYGKHLGINTLKYKKELNRLDKTSDLKKKITTSFKLEPKYNIKSVKHDKNSIIITFNQNIDSSYINFFEKKYKHYHRDYFDINGRYQYAKSKKITLKNVDKTIIYQHKKDILRIYIQNKKDPKTLFLTNKNQIIIKHIDIVSKKKKQIDKVKVLKEKISPSPAKAPSFLKDKKYTISDVRAVENTIIVEFNHKINKTYLDFYERKHKSFSRDYFDIKGNFKGAYNKKLKVSGIDKTVIYQHKKDKLRIYLQNRSNPKTIYIIGDNKIIIKNLSSLKKTKPLKKQDFIYPYEKTIVIDAGHGGKDPGATNGRKIYEKDIVLNISKFLRQELNRKGFKVQLTRDRDKYVKLGKRTKYANRKKADMFISIHANAVPKKKARKARGVETYFLSPARSARAKRVAALENKGDMGNMNWSSKSSLLTILNQGKITASNKMAIDIQKNMLYKLRKKYGKKAIRDGGVREGPFWVLVGAQMPSVLVEVGYISHPEEGRRIAKKSYQRLIAKAMADGIESYFLKN
ncbi:MAG: N-acetylmuramoyl-L-alanine amidase [Campylobacterota bacterium]|nr:N-acetylmuramoyl-L-alanine amidase [Campylobacterota bacterium]